MLSVDKTVVLEKGTTHDIFLVKKKKAKKKPVVTPKPGGKKKGAR